MLVFRSFLRLVSKFFNELCTKGVNFRSQYTESSHNHIESSHDSKSPEKIVLKGEYLPFPMKQQKQHINSIKNVFKGEMGPMKQQKQQISIKMRMLNFCRLPKP